MQSWKAHTVCLLNTAFPAAMTRILYRRRLGRPLDLREPKTYNDKANWLKLYAYPGDEAVIRCADKYLFREFAAERGLSRCLNPLLGAWDDPRDIDFDRLPDQFALKANHGCKMNIICRDKSAFDCSRAVRKLSDWLARDFGRETAQRHYCGIRRRVICEALIEGEAPGEPPDDYKVLCFNGRPVAINHSTNRSHGLLVTHYDPDWSRLPLSSHPSASPEPRPAALEELLSVARTLSEGFPFVRVDLYAPRGRVILGEMTFTPAAGYNDNITPEGDRWLGERLDISELVAARKRR